MCIFRNTSCRRRNICCGNVYVEMKHVDAGGREDCADNCKRRCENNKTNCNTCNIICR